MVYPPPNEDDRPEFLTLVVPVPEANAEALARVPSTWSFFQPRLGNGEHKGLVLGSSRNRPRSFVSATAVYFGIENCQPVLPAKASVATNCDRFLGHYKVLLP